MLLDERWYALAERYVVAAETTAAQTKRMADVSQAQHEAIEKQRANAEKFAAAMVAKLQPPDERFDAPRVLN